MSSEAPQVHLMLPETKPFPINSLYVHIPFCAGRCSYCDFFSVSARNCPQVFSLEYESSYVDAVLEQTQLWSEKFDAGPFSTIYIGGGTPSVLNEGVLERLVKGLEPYAASGCEWTVEANPESVHKSLLDMLAETKVTRISLGVQTLSHDEWPALQRVGSVEDSKRSIDLVREYPFELSVDVLAGIPQPQGRTEAWQSILLGSLEYLAERVSHISLYDLTLEEGTPLQRQVACGALVSPNADAMAEARDAANALLASRGFQRYEVSNYARSGHECRHNLAYWNMRPYLGVGSGAVSTIQYCDPEEEPMLGTMVRITGRKDSARYIAKPAEIPPEIEYIDRKTALFEFLMMGFRTARGVDTQRISSLFGVDVAQIIPSALARWKPGIVRGRHCIALHTRNFDILNRFLVECLEELDKGGLG
jgi:oxygen-independent coproporphyrinogen-3 oxidase